MSTVVAVIAWLLILAPIVWVFRQQLRGDPVRADVEAMRRHEAARKALRP